MMSPAVPADAAMHGGLRSLRILMLAGAAVALLLFAAFAATRHQQMHEEAEVRLQRAVLIAHEHAMRALDTNVTLGRHVRSLARAAEGDALHQELVELAQNKPQIESIRVHGADGRLLAGNRLARPPPGPSVAGQEFFQWHQANREGVFFGGVTAGDGGRPFFNISSGRARAKEAFSGTVSVGLYTRYFTDLHAELAADEPGLAITMFRQDGLVYSRWPALPHAPARMASSSEVLQRVQRGETAGAIRSVSSLDGQQRVIVFRKLGDYPVYIGTGRELSAINAEWRRELLMVAAFAVLPALGLVLAAYLAMKRTREALDAARRLQEESQARRQVEEALLQSQKMEALGRLTGGVAHDFNNALMVISGNLHLLKLTQPGVPDKYTGAMARAVESATQLTRQLLAFSRRQALAPETILLQERLPSLRDLLVPTLGSKISLAIEVAPDTAPIHVDAAELELALINLAVNARDAMPRGGSFRLAAGNVPAPGGGAPAGVWIEAQDSGEGMSPEVAAKAFDPFYTTKPLGKGTGLGLSQVHALCRRAGGDAQLRSTPGQGTTVRLQLPPSSAEPIAGPAPAGERPRFDHRTVLLVEDNPEVAAVVVPVLEKLGCRVVHHENADAALHWLRDGTQGADLLLSDVVMPGAVDGIGLARQVKERFPALKVLMMTGYAEQIDAIGRLGFEVLPKPFSPRALADALQRVLGAAKP